MGLLVKCIAVIDSCENLDQAKVAYNYINRAMIYLNKYSDYLILYERLTEHYKIVGPPQPPFQKGFTND